MEPTPRADVVVTARGAAHRQAVGRTTPERENTKHENHNDARAVESLEIAQ